MDSQVISFDLFEHQKENIQPLPEGRSAAALAKAFAFSSTSGTRGASSPDREHFEQRIAASENDDDSDDPLEIWLEYLKWIHETFPQGASTESGLICFLERCTSHFQTTEFYANDPRYLKVWLEYAKYNDSPREVFNFLFHNKIGLQLAALYEEFAALLEASNRNVSADEIYRMGITRAARPLERLKRRYGEFLERMSSASFNPDEPRSPILGVLRPALATKAIGETGEIAVSNTSQEQPEDSFGRSRQKITVFSDPDGSIANPIDRAGGWQTIGSISERRKENTSEVLPIQGQMMKMHSGLVSSQEKFNVFKEVSAASNSFHVSSTPSQPIFKVPSVSTSRGKREERFVVDLKSIYPDEDSEEYSFEELRAMTRGLLKNFSAKGSKEIKSKEISMENSSESISVPTARNVSTDKIIPFRDNTSSSTVPLKSTNETPVRISSSIQTLPLKGSPEQRVRPASPTMTMHTRAATEEIYNLFNQPLKCEADILEEREGVSDSSEDEDENDEEEEDDDVDVYHDVDTVKNSENDTGLEIQPTDRNSEVHAQVKSEELNELSDRLCPIPATPHNSGHSLERYSGMNLMTPIVETTEAFSTVSRSVRRMQITEGNNFSASSSPFIEHPTPRRNHQSDSVLDRPLSMEPQVPIISDLLVNPMDEGFRTAIMKAVQGQLSRFYGYQDCNLSVLGKSEALKRSLKHKKSNTKTVDESSIIALNKKSYRLVKELGEGAFAPVYLFESFSRDGETEDPFNSSIVAIKLETPPCPWEFYVIRTLAARWNCSENILYKRAQNSIISAKELYAFSDASCLLLEYNDQGTILDIVNLVKAENVKTSSTPSLGLDECLVMFFSIELLRTIEAMHEVDILHGDLKPDNCMIRLFRNQPIVSMASLSVNSTGQVKSKAGNEIEGPFNAAGEQGWSSKGIQLIDFGRAIDMRNYKSGVQFIADWETGQQDCAEMRETRPWTYQVDYHGLASIIHMMLFGKYIETVVDTMSNTRLKRYKLSQGFKRYWQQDIWRDLFELLLNSAARSKDLSAEQERSELPLTSKLRDCRIRMENYLEEQGEKGGVSLRSSLQKLESLVMRERRAH
ncbi:Mad3/BUB1 homology region 1-domain-containing protein [Lipomyces oligophaga]|uniref:Mad3/BUB1 homology region 1-domain-containing protein n=1 Tax=Lipomyces oligophaga TaxID=45792 RepID=UPI0034CD65A2